MGRKPINPRELSNQEQMWVQEIVQEHADWADVDLSHVRLDAECDCGRCGTVYFEAASTQNLYLKGTKGYIGRVEIIILDEFLITVTLDQADGRLGELYIDFMDTSSQGDRLPPLRWQETTHIVTRM